jgi:hypothetical protein
VRGRALSFAIVAALALALPGLALNIKGTSRNDVLRGTAKADRIDGKRGNDRLFGLGGNDILIGGPGADTVSGGPGADRLLLRDGTRDVAICGPGADTVVADALDVTRPDCEVVQRPQEPQPPTPEPPPAAPITPGSYRGLLEGNFILFDVLADRTVTHMRSNYIREECGDGSYVYGTLDFGEIRIPIANVTGTYASSSEFDWEGQHYRCTSGTKQWTASLLT